MKNRIFSLVLGVLVPSILAVDYEAIECPLPVDVLNTTAAECENYSACEFSVSQQRCHMKSNSEAGYFIASNFIPTLTGYKVVLQKSDASLTLYDSDIEDLVLEVVYHDDQHLQIKITDPINARYEIPYALNLDAQNANNPLYEVSIGDSGGPMSISIVRAANLNSIFQMIGPLTYENQFIQFTTSLASKDLYGLGENYRTALRHSFDQRRTYPLFSCDRNTIDPAEYNHYGVHPYYVNVEDDSGNTHSVLFYNSNAMEYSTFTLEDGVTPVITFRTIGGIIDLHFFLGPTPEDVNIQYMNMIGKPVLPPYWSLGFTLSRWNYSSTDNYRIVRQRMKDAAIPMDVQTFDIDYMDGRKDFTYDPQKWSDLPALIDELHGDDVKLTLILDSAISLYYPSSQRGFEQDAFVKWIFSGYIPENQPEGAEDTVVGKVWPNNHTTFPDFFNENGSLWWNNEIESLYSSLDFDAIWIDMNEPSNFGTNLNDGINILFCPENNFDSPPYPTRASLNDRNPSQRLSDKTICMIGKHTIESKTYLHYDVHNLYGLSETIATYKALDNVFPGMRHVVLSRSTFVGSGRYAFHWLGDNAATWDQMKLSIVGMIEFNIFGITMVGADICGFNDASNMELCARWMQLGAFYPYSRNHNDDDSPDQDPAMWPEVAEISRNVLSIRYSYLPYLFSLLFRSHTEGGSVIRPLFNVFPSDINCRGIDDQFFWGDAMMIAPVLDQGTDARDVYFPDAKWYDLTQGYLVEEGPNTVTIDAPLEIIPLYLRGGKIVPFQGSGVTTVESRSTNFGFTIAADAELFAKGELFWDDGITDSPISDTFHMTIELSGTIDSLINVTSTIINNATVMEGVLWDRINIYGLPCPCDFGITLLGNPLEPGVDVTCNRLNSTVSVAVLAGLEAALPLNQEIHLSMSNFAEIC